MKKLTLFTILGCLTFTYVCCAMEICDVGDEHHNGSHIDLDEGFDYQIRTDI